MQNDTFTVKEGETIRGVATRLKKQNLITSDKLFIAIGRTIGTAGIRKGKYRINAGDSSLGILFKFMKGDVVKRKITIPEGFNIYSIAERLAAQQIVETGDFLYYAFNTAYLESIGIRSASAEGYLFPDTYLLPESSDARDVIAVMHKRFRQVVASTDISARDDIKLTTHELITLASLIEKEARIASERRYISAVFHNRLEKGMKLDCDPTVRYAVKNFTGRITFGDLASNSPFNTYVHRGLPPTPICSPGKESIEAALYPADAGYFFFVARNDGSHYFSKNLKEHNRAVNYYQKGIRNGFKDTQRL